MDFICVDNEWLAKFNIEYMAPGPNEKNLDHDVRVSREVKSKLYQICMVDLNGAENEVNKSLKKCKWAAEMDDEIDQELADAKAEMNWNLEKQNEKLQA